MTRKKCEKCKNGFKILTKEGLCLFCFKNKFGYWSNEFNSRKGKGMVKK